MTETRPLALVTGASSGIGFELAREFATNGFDVIVNAEDDAIHTAAAKLATTPAQVIAVQADLATDKGVDKLYAAATGSGRPLDAVALNAGVGQGGGFLDAPLADQLRVVDLNVRGTVQLAHRLLNDMVARGEGRLLVTSSIASMMPGANHATYNASKSFLQSFTEALQAELAESPVTVTSLMPGPTDTEFFGRAGLGDAPIGRGPKDDPTEVARQGFEAMMRGDRRVVTGSLLTKAQAVVGRVLPDVVKAAAHRIMAEPGLGR